MRFLSNGISSLPCNLSCPHALQTAVFLMFYKRHYVSIQCLCLSSTRAGGQILSLGEGEILAGIRDVKEREDAHKIMNLRILVQRWRERADKGGVGVKEQRGCR